MLQSIVNAPLVKLSSTCRLKTQTTQKVRLDLNSFIRVVIRGAITIDSSLTPTLAENPNEHPIRY
jgi:hypothetical protein